MKEGYLSQYFEKVAAKRLSEVEVDLIKSNQHEFNGSKALRNIMGKEKLQNFPVRFIRFGNIGETSNFSENGFITWYDAREKHPTRSEYRLYFKNNTVMEVSKNDDLLIVTSTPDGKVDIITAECGSTYENQLIWLFGLSAELDSRTFDFQTIKYSQDQKVSFIARTILDELGIAIKETESQYYDHILSPFLKNGFPTTKVFSELARNELKHLSPKEDPDETLIQWIDFEEKLFRRLEKHIVEKELERMQYQKLDVETFIKFSLSIHNRRKSRIGYALENHLQSIFTKNNVHYSYNKITENNSKPDFLFPEIELYHDLGFPEAQLTMLGVKSTCKDRWRQVLTEAKRINPKHLLTLEPGISENQTLQMKAQNLRLVLPQSLHDTYKPSQRSELINLKTFINAVLNKQTIAKF